DERRQATDRLAGLLAALRLLMLRTALLDLLIARRERLRVGRQIGLRLRLRLEARLALTRTMGHERLAVVAVVIIVVTAALLWATGLLPLLRLLLVVGVLLAELFLRGSDEAEIVLGVL